MMLLTICFIAAWAVYFVVIMGIFSESPEDIPLWKEVIVAFIGGMPFIAPYIISKIEYIIEDMIEGK